MNISFVKTNAFGILDHLQVMELQITTYVKFYITYKIGFKSIFEIISFN